MSDVTELNNGYAVIFNQEKFKYPYLSKRKGTNIDENALRTTLENFNVNVKVCKDYSFDEISAQVEKLKTKDFKPYHSLIIVVLTHGDENNILCANDKSYKLYDTIVFPIIKNKTLFGKPKIFIIQACRGNLVTDTRILTEPSVPMPFMLDMFFGFSTSEGYKSMRDETTGGIFIQSFCQMINKHNTSDITNIMQRVTKALATQHGAQVSTITSTLSEPYIFADIGKKIKEYEDRVKMGYAIIFDTLGNNSKDLAELKNAIEMFNINVDVKQIFELSEIRTEVKKISESDLTGYDFFVIALISQTSLKKKPMMLSLNMIPYDFFDTIIYPLTLKNSDFARKPKIVVICAKYMTIPYCPNIPSDIQNMSYAVFPYKDIPRETLIEIFNDNLKKYGCTETINEVMDRLKKTFDLYQNENSSIIISKMTEEFSLRVSGKEFLQPVFMNETVCEALSHAIKIGHIVQTQKAITYIGKHMSSILKTKAFLNSNRKVLEIILNIDEIGPVTEIEVFSAVMKWAEEKCNLNHMKINSKNKREQLGYLIKFIRFPNMTPKEFTDCIQKENELLTDNEKVQLYMSYYCEINHEFKNEPRK